MVVISFQIQYLRYSSYSIIDLPKGSSMVVISFQIQYLRYS